MLGVHERRVLWLLFVSVSMFTGRGNACDTNSPFQGLPTTAAPTTAAPTTTPAPAGCLIAILEGFVTASTDSPLVLTPPAMDVSPDATTGSATLSCNFTEAALNIAGTYYTEPFPVSCDAVAGTWNASTATCVLVCPSPTVFVALTTDPATSVSVVAAPGKIAAVPVLLGVTNAGSSAGGFTIDMMGPTQTTALAADPIVLDAEILVYTCDAASDYPLLMVYQADDATGLGGMLFPGTITAPTGTTCTAATPGYDVYGVFGCLPFGVAL